MHCWLVYLTSLFDECNCLQHNVTILWLPLYSLPKWRGVLHHVVNQHEWVLGDGYGPGVCEHGHLPSEERDKDWLKRGGNEHERLRRVVLDKRFLNNIGRYVDFR